MQNIVLRNDLLRSLHFLKKKQGITNMLNLKPKKKEDVEQLLTSSVNTPNNRKNICFYLNNLNTFTKETNSPDMKQVLIR